ncbi:MAG: hypothetical protein HY040_07410 [Planctomycetes bacterium]|nr:hypothetical protein [Planctomycetota bacterium]
MDIPDLSQRADTFATREGLTLGDQLGSGVQGIVFSAKIQAEEGRLAIKVHNQGAAYCRERDVYLRLQNLAITNIHRCNVPELVDYDDELWILAMTVVKRPFVLDFGGAHLDRPLDFSDEVWADWRKDKHEQFGSAWPRVEAILRHLEGLGIYVEDVNPGNIVLPD